MPLGHGDQEGVEFVEERRITGEVLFQEVPERLVVPVGRYDPVSGQNPSRVGIGHVDWAAGRVEQNGVGRLGADPGHGQEIVAQGRERRLAESLQAAGRPDQEEPSQGEQAPRLEPSGARGTDEPADRRGRLGGPAPWLEPAGRAKIGDGPCGAGPGGMLGEHGADGDLEGAPCRPPALRAVALV